MAVTNFTPLLGLALPTTGDLSGTWGTTVNDAITDLIDDAVAGTVTLSANADVTLTTTNGADNQARNAVILWTASNGATPRNVTAPAQSKAYIVINAGTGSVVIRGAGPTTGVTVASGFKALVAWNGSDFVKVASSLVSLTSDVTGVLPIANGGTNSTATATAGGVGYGTGTAHAYTGASTGGYILTSGGAGAPAFIQTLPVANGGTGLTSGTSGGVLAYTATGTLASSVALTANALVLGAGAGATPTPMGSLGTTTTVLHGNAGGAPTFGAVSLSADVTGNLPVSNLNSGTSASASTFWRGDGTWAAAGASAATPTALGTVYGSMTTSGASPYLTALGYNAGAASTGVGNVGVGVDALKSVTSGAYNSALGYQALSSGATALYSNSAVGYQALQSCTGEQNTALGYQALKAHTSNSNSTGIGWSALVASTGTRNTSLGYSSGSAITSGSQNVIIGSYTGSATPISATGSNYVVLSDGDGNIVASTKTAQTFALQNGTLTSGTGIAFPATQSASSDANTLDDYEEGTWTPAYTPNAGAFTTATYSRQVGVYQKIGNTVHAQMYIHISGFVIGTATGPVYISGLPFTASGSTEYQSGTVGYTYQWETNSPTKCALYQSTTRIDLFRDAQGVLISSPEITVLNLKNGNPADALSLAISYKMA